MIVNIYRWHLAKGSTATAPLCQTSESYRGPAAELQKNPPPVFWRGDLTEVKAFVYADSFDSESNLSCLSFAIWASLGSPLRNRDFKRFETCASGFTRGAAPTCLRSGPTVMACVTDVWVTASGKAATGWADCGPERAISRA